MSGNNNLDKCNKSKPIPVGYLKECLTYDEETGEYRLKLENDYNIFRGETK